MKHFKMLACLLFLFGSIATAQVLQKDYKIHKRGMLNQTVYNTGELGRRYTAGSTTTLGVPSFEWPANSATIVDKIQYTGQHNSYGEGVQIGADRIDSSARLYAYCGGLSDAVSEYVSSFPLKLERIENYPVLANGDLNPAYNPDEAEEIIISKWATPVGVTITRTSRAWSFPDYDDFITYEYEFENTGDLTGNPSVPPRPVRLKDLVIDFSNGLTSGKFGWNRTSNNSWSTNRGNNGQLYARWDRQRWLKYVIHRSGIPEPTYFAEWAATGKNGGGLLAPQAPGYMCLYYDTTHLVRRYGTGIDSSRVIIDTSAWDSHNHIKQPYSLRMETEQLTLAKIPDVIDITRRSRNGPNTNVNIYGSDWYGRSYFNWRQSNYFGVGQEYGFGPYMLDPGQKIRITMADVCGYGAARLAETQAGLKDEGGSCGQGCSEAGDSLYAFMPVWNWYQPLTNYNHAVDNTMGSDYLSKYPLPEYVNSNVVTVREVADRAIQIYTGDSLRNHNSLQYWPEKFAEHGVYKTPIPVPAPSIAVENTLLGENRIVWGPQVESFTSSRLQGTLDHYELFRSSNPLGPWVKLASMTKGDPKYFIGGKYQFIDRSTRIGDNFYYSVLSIDNNGNKSGRTNITLHESSMGATTSLQQVYVAPNPFIVKSGFQGESVGGDINSQLRFFNLPRTCTIRIYSYSGQLVQTIEHDVDAIEHPYFQITRNNQLVASGVYFFVVDAPGGSRCHGKFVIIN